MNTVQSSESLEVPKLPIRAEVLEWLSPAARRTLVGFEADVDGRQRGEILSLPHETDYDRMWVPVLAMRIWRDRFEHHWKSVGSDPRFPNFKKISFGDMTGFTPLDSQPAEAVFLLVLRFAPRGYGAGWLANRLQSHMRPETFANGQPVKAAA